MFKNIEKLIERHLFGGFYGDAQCDGIIRSFGCVTFMNRHFVRRKLFLYAVEYIRGIGSSDNEFCERDAVQSANKAVKE